MMLTVEMVIFLLFACRILCLGYGNGVWGWVGAVQLDGASGLEIVKTGFRFIKLAFRM